jgi:predicted metal-binding membrane protein
VNRVGVRAPRSSKTSVPALVLVLVLAAGAWLAVVVGDHSHVGPGDAMPHHHEFAGTPVLLGVGPALAGWTLMVVAMMLPPAVPLVGVLARLLTRRRHSLPGVLAGLAAFVGVWVVVGAVLVTGDAVIDALTGPWSPTARVRLAGVLVLLAGLYQFAPVKNACLTACRSPRWFALRFWRGRAPVTEAATLSAAYGVSCVGCCWALMLLGLGAGALALPVMVTLTVVMTAERLVPGRAVIRLVRGVGALLVAGGLALLAGIVPASLVHPFLGV